MRRLRITILLATIVAAVAAAGAAAFGFKRSAASGRHRGAAV